ncbi:MAG TPA: PQQ-binding-like beta-propeller repeat protein [Verrucomicrobiae bacterium]|nr:PQQ-binding-like beta-propeller repeat protein [Verrucomicrobiae bacterium]
MTALLLVGLLWPEFRGPTGQGISTATNLPVVWSTTSNVVWRQTIPGLGWSSPVLAGDGVFLTTAIESNNVVSLRALCLHARTGKMRWNTEAFAPAVARAHTKNSQASPTPLIEGERLYVHYGHYGTACMDLAGKILWRTSAVKYSPVHGNAGSPIIAGDALIFNCDGAENPFVVALDKNSGDVLWKFIRNTDAKKKFSFSTPLLVNGQVITVGSGAVFALDPKSGKELWQVPFAEGYSVVPRPVFGHGLIFISTGFDRPVVMAIGPGERSAEVAWTLNRGAPNTPSLLLVGDELYIVSDGGMASCVDARTGKVHWYERVGGNYSASPVYADGKIYLQSEEGKGVVLQAGKEFRKLSENALDEKSLASYAVGDGTLYIRTAEHLYCIGKGS